MNEENIILKKEIMIIYIVTSKDEKEVEEALSSGWKGD